MQKRKNKNKIIQEEEEEIEQKQENDNVPEYHCIGILQIVELIIMISQK